MLRSITSGGVGKIVERLSRRRLFARAGAVAGAAAFGAALLDASPQQAHAAEKARFGPAKHQFNVTDFDILNFALNLEYLEAEFYLHAAYGVSLPDADIGPGGNKAIGTQGAVIGGRQAALSDPVVIGLAQQLAKQEEIHVQVLRAALGSAAVPRPTIDIGPAFTTAAVAAGIIPAGQTFDPYASDADFLLGSFIFEDVGVTAYHGAAPFIRNPEYLSTAAGILGTEAYHAGAIRAFLLDRAQTDATLAPIAQKISDLRDTADGTGDDDQGIVSDDDQPGPLLNGTNVNIAPTDGSAVTFARTFQQVLNIVYLGGQPAGFGFFPNLLNGRIK